MAKNILIFLISLITCFGTAYAQTDSTIGLTSPSNLGTDYQAIASYLCIDMKTERQKANAIYNWVTHNITYDVDALWKIPKHPVKDVVEQTLKTKKGICDGYASVFTALCKAAGMNAVTIEGYAKDWVFDNGDKFHVPRHAWSAVKVDGKWQLADPTWGAGYLHQSPTWLGKLIDKLRKNAATRTRKLKFTFRYDPQYFLQDPETFRLKHLPADPYWQLTDSAMPITVFEAGDSAVASFNELYSAPAQANPKLDKISSLTDDERHFEMADRAYAFNNNYPVVLARKSLYSADAIITRAFNDESVGTPDIMIRDAANSLKDALKYIEEQKKSMPEVYSGLKRKNRSKATAAKQYMRRIRIDDKRLISECKRHENSIDSKYSRGKKKLAKLQQMKQPLDANKIDDVETLRMTKKQDAPEMVTIMDSIAARNERVAIRHQATADESTTAKDEIITSGHLLDSLANSLTGEDSMLRNEAYQRMSMHDSYDDEVIKWSNYFKEQKYQTSDTLLKYYFAAFDSIATKYERLHKAHLSKLSLFKKNLSDMERYKKRNKTNPTLKSDYATLVQDYAAAIDSASTDMAIYLSYLKGNKDLFGKLKKLGERQISILDFMEKAEKSRQILEESNLSKKKEFDLKENEMQEAAVKKALKQVQELVDYIDNPE